MQDLHCANFCGDFAGDATHAGSGRGMRTPEDQSLMAQQPSLLVELSPATSGFDVTVKLSECQSVSCVDHILFVDTENPRVLLYSRVNGVWKSRLVEGLDAVIQLERLNVTLGLRDIYDGLELRPRQPIRGMP